MRAVTAPFPFSTQRRVRFHETDAMGVVHHASYLRYLEDARVDFLREIGRPYSTLRDVEGIEFAVIGIELAYRAPLRFDELFEVHAGIGSLRRASFTIEYLVEREGVAVLDGHTRHATLEVGTHRAIRVPHWLAAAGRAPGHVSNARVEG
jgi:acyl-CoA thioester hydrolase